MENESSQGPVEVFLGRLRSETAPMHKALEENAISKSLMDPNVSLSQYAFYLACMGEVMKVYDNLILPDIAEIVGDTNERRKYQDLQSDVMFLVGNGAEIKDPKAFQGYPSERSLAYALGYAYVIEGSTLGGRVILKHIHKTLGLEGDGTRFFSGYGPETGSFWKRFLEEFCSYIIENNAQEEAIKGTKEGFTHIGQHFASNG